MPCGLKTRSSGDYLDIVTPDDFDPGGGEKSASSLLVSIRKLNANVNR
jgi:hypothetical protein